MRFGFAWRSSHAFETGADAAAIGFGPDRAYFNPVVIEGCVAAYQLGIVIHRVDHDVDVSIVVAVAKSAAPPRHRIRDSWSAFEGNICEIAISHVRDQQLALRKPRVALHFLHL